VLGAIPRLADGITPATAAADLRSPFAESYRSVRTALQFATTHGLPYSLLLTSPGASEGKSTSAMELARNIAALGKRVLLIDADLRNPSLHRLFGAGNGKGLSNVLSGGAEVTEVVQPSAEANLSLVTSGPLPPNPPELLAGDNLVRMFEALRTQFDMIVIDGPPILGLADAPLLASRVEATLLVVAADKTRSDSLQLALHRLLGTHAHVIGTLLTRFDSRRKGDYYGYGGYEYGGNKA
jgi:capsular exopolysaccharide synthesis family protein